MYIVYIQYIHIYTIYTTLYSLGWLLKNQKITNAGEDVEKLELCTLMMYTIENNMIVPQKIRFMMSIFFVKCTFYH